MGLIKKQLGDNEEDYRKYIQEDLEKLKKVGRGILEGITYPIRGTFAFPTIIRKADSQDDKYFEAFPMITICSFASISISNLLIYMKLSETNPKLILPTALTQIVTNLLSGGYEYYRHVKKKTKEEAEKTKIKYSSLEEEIIFSLKEDKCDEGLIREVCSDSILGFDQLLVDKILKN